MAPEQYTRGVEYSHYVDFWAAAVMHHEMLTGEPPFAGPWANMSNAIKAGEFRRVPLWRALSPGAQAFVRRLLDALQILDLVHGVKRWR